MLFSHEINLLLMELFLPNVFLYGGCLVATAFLLGMVGMFVMRLMPEWRGGGNGFLNLFNAIMIGLTMLIPLFAVVWARGNSIMWIAVLLWGYYILRTRKRPHAKETDEWKMDWKAVLLAVVVLLSVYILFYYLFFVRSGGSLCGDYVYYANVSCVLMEEHIETGRFQSLFRFPVHGESWFTALCALVFGLKPVYVLLLLTYPIFFFLIMIGVAAACVDVLRVNKVLALVLGVAIMFFKPIVSLVIPWQCILFLVPKLYIVTAFVVWCALMLLKSDFRKAFVAVCFLVPFYSTVSAGVLTFVFLMAIGLKWHETHSWRCLWNEYSVAAVAVALLFFMFYMVQDNSPIEAPEKVFDREMAIQALLYAARWITKSCILLLPSFLVMLYLGKKNPERFSKGWIAVAAVATSCAITILIGGFLQHISRDGIQVMTNYVDSARIVCCFVVTLAFISFVADKFAIIPRQWICCLFAFYPLRYYDEGVRGSWFWPSHSPYSDIENSGIMELEGKNALFAVFRLFSEDESVPVKYFSIRICFVLVILRSMNSLNLICPRIIPLAIMILTVTLSWNM